MNKDKENTEKSEVEGVVVDIPEFKTDGLLNGHEFRQEGEVLICVDDPSLSAKLPLGVRLYGERGNYRFEKIF